MITIELEKEYINSLFFDGLKSGKSQFSQKGNKYFAKVSMEEYDLFIRENNLISYGNFLKQYEDGAVIGTIETDRM